MLQFERGYKLVVGDSRSGDAVTLTEHQMTFEIVKSVNNKNKTNSATVEIYNLPYEVLKKFDKEFTVCSLDVGYYGSGIKNILIGEVTEIKTTEKGPDRVTQLLMGEGYLALNETKLSTIIPEGQTVADVIEEIRQTMPNVDRGVYTGLNIQNQVLYGYPLSGSAKQALDEISEQYRLEWKIDKNVLTITDERGLETSDLNTAVVLTNASGLLEEPFETTDSNGRLKQNTKRRSGIQFKALLNPDLSPGKIVEIRSQAVNGWFRVETARFSGDWMRGPWTVECFCNIILEEDIANAANVS